MLPQIWLKDLLDAIREQQRTQLGGLGELEFYVGDTDDRGGNGGLYRRRRKQVIEGKA